MGFRVPEINPEKWSVNKNWVRVSSFFPNVVYFWKIIKQFFVKIWRNALFNLRSTHYYYMELPESKTRVRVPDPSLVHICYTIISPPTLHRSQCTLLLWRWNLKLYVCTTSQKLSDSSYFKCKMASSSKNDVNYNYQLKSSKPNVLSWVWM